MRSYSLDLRQRIVDAYENGEGSIRELAKRFEVAPNTVYDYLTRMRATGSVAPCPHGGGVAPKLDQTGLQHVRSLLDEKNDRTLAELGKELTERYSLTLSRATLARAVQGIGMTRKKRPFMRASRTDPMCNKPVRASDGERGRLARID